MKHGHPSREHSHGKEHRTHQESMAAHGKRGIEHLKENHKEERREVERGEHKERGWGRR